MYYKIIIRKVNLEQRDRDVSYGHGLNCCTFFLDIQNGIAQMGVRKVYMGHAAEPPGLLSTSSSVRGFFRDPADI